jgi:hypothetical protein
MDAIIDPVAASPSSFIHIGQAGFQVNANAYERAAAAAMSLR